MESLRGDLLTLPERAHDQATAAVAAALSPPIASVVSSARARWPIKSGRSRDALSATTLPTRGAVVVEDSAPYTTAIVSHGNRPWQDFVIAPLLALARRELPMAIGRELLTRLAGSHRG